MQGKYNKYVRKIHILNKLLILCISKKNTNIIQAINTFQFQTYLINCHLTI